MGDRKFGTIILTVMAGLWCAVGSITFGTITRIFVLSFAGVITVLLLYGNTRSAPALTKFHDRAFWFSAILEGVGIGVAVPVLILLHMPSFILPAIAIIAGLHFIGMQRATEENIYLWVAVGMCLVGFAGVVLPFPTRMQAAGLGCAIVLWAGSAWRISGRT